jgi:sugar phosphate permease
MSYQYNEGLSTPIADPRNLNDVYRKVTWRIVPFFCLCYLAAYLDRINVGLAKLQMLNDLNFSEEIYALGAGLFFIGYIMFEIPSNIILQKMGARLWIARIMITWGALSAATMFVTTPMQFYVVRFLLGVAEAGFFPGVMLYLTYWYPTHKRSKIMAIFLIGLPMAAMIGSPLSGWIMTAFADVHGLKGWQWLFLLEGIPSVMLGVIVFMWLPNNIETSKWLNQDEKKELRGNLDKDVLSENRHSLKDAFTSGRVWLLGTIDMCLMMSAYAISFWLPTIIRDSGINSPQEIGFYTGIPHAFAILALLVAGYSSDKYRERRWHIAIPMIIGAIGLAGSTFATSNPAATVFWFTIANIGIIGALPAFWCLPATFLTGPAAAAGIALIASIANIGGFSATYILGWLKGLTHTPGLGLFIFAGFLIFGCVLALSLPAKIVNK